MVLPAAGGYPVVMADIFSVVADQARRDILFLLLERSRGGEAAPSAAEIAGALGLTSQGVAAHLKVLVDNGFVTVDGEGSTRSYALDSEPLEELAEWLLPFLDTGTASASAVDEAGATVFAAWSGVGTGDSIGRAIADRSHGVRVAVESAVAKVATVLPENITKRRTDRP
jgi:ArsR family transcriptional regulator, arsenate/arsenite/antimonite-responsive transcriptional repressor